MLQYVQYVLSEQEIICILVHPKDFLGMENIVLPPVEP